MGKVETSFAIICQALETVSLWFLVHETHRFSEDAENMGLRQAWRNETRQVWVRPTSAENPCGKQGGLKTEALSRPVREIVY